MMDMLKLARLREYYKAGMRIALIEMDDAYAVPSGTKGTIDFIDDAGTIFVSWDNGSRLGLVYGVDKFKII